ncbi:replicative DNA helicase [Kribbella sp. VKM Ac-2568]|uniref:replicative DNA helicase n=1 Tax=Kribbella sp. VKM Ac-2568 TaxID=2512219 RepID=UPI0018EE5277|nr:replicative DNA helicase [Kribbella sp. VKM Ac-2568]
MGFDRTPPQDLAAEQCVLGAMMLSKDAIADVIETLRGTDFYRPAHEIVFDAVTDLYARGEPADAITVAAELTKRGEMARIGGAPYVHTLVASVPLAANAGYYAHIVREKAILRRLVEAGTKIVQIGYAGEGEVDDVVDQAQAEIYSVTEKRTTEDYAPLKDIMEGALDEIEAIDSRGDAMVGVPTGFTDLDELTNGLHPGQMIIIAARPAMGKALALDTPLATPTGWTTMGDVAVGDDLIGADGRPTKVVAATEAMHDRPCYELTFSDGSTLVADAEHQWRTETRASRKARWSAEKNYNRYRNQAQFAEIRTTAEIADTLHCPGNEKRVNHSIDNATALALPEIELPLPPYALGVWLGDGHSASARFTSADPEVAMFVEATGLVVRYQSSLNYSMQFPREERVRRTCVVCGETFLPRTKEVRTCGQSCGGKARFVSAPVAAPTCPDCGNSYAGGVRCQSCHADHGTVQAVLRKIGVLGNKHIPGEYLRASESQRRELLAGLLDTDGTVNPTGSCQITLTNERLALDVYELIVSLGYKCGHRTRVVAGRSPESSIGYVLTFSTVDDVFKLSRKMITHKERRPASTVRIGNRLVKQVKRIDTVPVRCVEVANDDHLYLAGKSMIPTHNSTLGLDFARSASIRHGLTSCIFSLEMSRNEITMRLLSAEAKVPLHHMRNGKMTDEDWARLARKMGEVSEAPLFIDDSPNLTMMEIRAKARRLKQRHDLKMIVIDYLQLMTSGKKVESRQLEVSEFSRSIKLLAKELEIPVIAICQLNRGSEQRSDKRPMASDLRESGCLTADTRLMRADTGAEISLGDLLAADARDVPVWSLDDRLKLVPRTMTHVFPSGVKEVFRLKLASGREIKATANHPFLTYDGWKPLSELVPGARLGSLRHVPPPLNVKPWDDDEVTLLAHLLGDGSFVKRQPIRYASIDEENLSAVASAAQRRFGITPIRDEYAAARVTTLRLPAPYRLARGKRNPIAAWLDTLGLFGLRSHEKFVPEGVFGLPKEQVGAFIRHLWATDGSVRWDDKGGQGRIYYASTSRRLVDDLARLLLRYNIFSRIKVAKKDGYRDSYHLHIYGAENQLRFCDEIGVHGLRGLKAVEVATALRAVRANTNLDTIPKEVWSQVRAVLSERKVTHRDFAAAMGTQFSGSTLWKHAPSRQRLAKVAGVLDDADLEVLATNDIFWDTITSIESLGEQEVYDATVMGTHNFVAEGIATHNSLEQDADVVILLHREDAYERESTRPGEADFIVAKHRNGPTADVVVAFQGHYSRFVDMAHDA